MCEIEEESSPVFFPFEFVFAAATAGNVQCVDVTVQFCTGMQ